MVIWKLAVYLFAMRSFYLCFCEDFLQFEKRLVRCLSHSATESTEYFDMLNTLRSCHGEGLKMSEQGINLNMRRQFRVGDKTINVILRNGRPGILDRLFKR